MYQAVQQKQEMTGESSGRFEVQSWFFMRISGILLVFLVLGHVLIMTVINDFADINYDFVAARWAMPVWRVYDWLLLSLGLLHGANGIRWIIDDHVHNPGWRVFAQTSLYVVTFVLFVLGSIILFVFQPVQ